MIERYKTVSIIYGGSGKEYAKNLRDVIEEAEKTERYPLSAKIVMESILTKDILSEVTALFRETQICVAILTAEDCCKDGGEEKYRLRQNVVFELGMALFHLGRERCILLGDFKDKKGLVDLPSDMTGLDVKELNARNKDEVFGEVLKKILKLSATLEDDEDREPERYDNLLTRENYYIDYSRLFSHYNKEYGAKKQKYLQSLMDEWLLECASLKNFDERLMYVMERISFTPIFGKQDLLQNWYEKIEGVVGGYKEKDINYYGGRKVLDYAKGVLRVVNAYIRLKMVDGVNPSLADYEELMEEFELNPPPKNTTINPLVDILYYDYKGLISMHLYSYTKDKEMLAQARACYEKVVDEYVDKVDLSLRVWSGFLYYNLGRLYGKIREIDPNAVSVDLMMEAYKKAVSIRKRWLNVPGCHGVVRNALSYEYFIAKLDQINQMKILGIKDADEIAKEYGRVECELENYCNAEERLERLVFVKDMLNEYRTK